MNSLFGNRLEVLLLSASVLVACGATERKFDDATGGGKGGETGSSTSSTMNHSASTTGGGGGASGAGSTSAGGHGGTVVADGSVQPDAPGGSAGTTQESGTDSLTMSPDDGKDQGADGPTDAVADVASDTFVATPDAKPDVVDAGQDAVEASGAPVCGNGTIEALEQCDLGANNTGGYGGCNGDCTFGPRCGDAMRNGPEACDDGTSRNRGQYGGCNPDCTLAPYCGDGTRNGTEACDNGTANNTGAYGGCNANCTPAAYCGDGTVNGGSEVCDNGTANNTGAYGGCNANCSRAPFCGDSVINGPESCDNGGSNGNAPGRCNPDCTGIVQTKHIRVYATRVAPAFPGVTGADSLCSGSFPGSKAFIVDGVNRIATATPLAGDGQVNWTVKRWTQYVDINGNVIWTTDRSALLGVNNGVAGTLTHPVAPTDDGWNTWTGMNPDYTTGSHCAGWTSNLSSDYGLSANPTATAVGSSFPNNGSTSNCAQTRRIICVEQ